MYLERETDLCCIVKGAGMPADVIRIFKKLSSIPTAPFREGGVSEYIQEFCAARNINVTFDNMGNLVAVYGSEFKNNPLAFCAHMDHPGFIADRDSARGRASALFYGGVEKEYFPGAAVRFFTGHGDVRARVTSVRTDKKTGIKKAYLKTGGPVSSGDTGMWDLTPCRIHNGKIYSRSCDDTVGVASILALLDRCAENRIRKKVMGVFTAAEEPGLYGAKYVCLKKRIPLKAYVIAIETSMELPGAVMGKGAVVRVGDRLSVFDPGMTAFICDAGNRLKAEKRRVRYQRQLMTGGVCESTVYQKSGYRTGAVCVPLGNYHNRDFRKRIIAAEYVSVEDLRGMVDLFAACVRYQENLESFTAPTPAVYRVEKGMLGETFVRDAGHR